MSEQQTDSTAGAEDRPVRSSAGLAARDGDRVRFVGFSAASWEYPRVAVGEEGTVDSARKPDQGGWDYWVKMDSGGRFAFQEREVVVIAANGIELSDGSGRGPTPDADKALPPSDVRSSAGLDRPISEPAWPTVTKRRLVIGSDGNACCVLVLDSSGRLHACGNITQLFEVGATLHPQCSPLRPEDAALRIDADALIQK